MKAPAFQWYPKDCDTDEKVRAMDDAEFGFYVRCLNHAWLNDGVPEDFEEFSRVIGRKKSQIEKLWVRVGRCFFLENGRYRNARQEAQRQAQQQFRDKRKQAAASRWDASAMQVHLQNDASAMQVQCSASASASAIHIDTALPRVDDPSPEPAGAVKKKRSKQPKVYDPLIEDLASRLHGRHPSHRRGSPSEIKQQLEKIFELHPKEDHPSLVERIDTNHVAACASHGWRKDRGQFAKGLVNWLAPTKGRWEDAPSQQSLTTDDYDPGAIPRYVPSWERDDA